MDKPVHLQKYTVGAYTTSPNLFTWDKPSETEYFSHLRELKMIRGLELPFWGESLHPFDDHWLLGNLKPSWENVYTCLPGTMKRLADDPYFGLASTRTASRKAAINFYRTAWSCINRLKSEFGETSLHAIHITSSPRNIGVEKSASVTSLSESLKELLDWDWGKTKILIEHCDAWTAQNPSPHKGFLTLGEEIEALEQAESSGTPHLGIVLNWARSVIETRDVAGVCNHIDLAQRHNMLKGIMFSGTTDNTNNLYGKWSDLHMPPANYQDFQYGEPASLLSFFEIKRSLKASDFENLEYIGIKLLAMPDESSMEKRIGINREALQMLYLAIEEL